MINHLNLVDLHSTQMGVFLPPTSCARGVCMGLAHPICSRDVLFPRVGRAIGPRVGSVPGWVLPYNVYQGQATF